MTLPFTGQAAVVTGATSGIGAAVAQALAAGGALVHALGRSASGNKGGRSPSGNEGARQIPDDTGALVWHRVDLTEDAGIVDFAATLDQDAGLDILVHGAGLYATGAVATAPVTEFDALWRINLRAPYLLTQALLPSLRRRRGQVVFVNSSVWANARAGLAAYAAGKYALKALADALRAEEGASGLRVLSVFPGRTATPMQAKIFAAEGGAYRPEALLQPEDIAATLVSALGLPRTAEVTDLHIRPGRKP